jgi:hypothetical protein
VAGGHGSGSSGQLAQGGSMMLSNFFGGRLPQCGRAHAYAQSRLHGLRACMLRQAPGRVCWLSIERFWRTTHPQHRACIVAAVVAFDV